MALRNPEIEILMATWNGARFLRDQLDSLFCQTFQNFSLTVRDDGSTDSTLKIIEDYRHRYSERVVVHRNLVRLGPCANFSLLAQQSSAPYVAFCDQDDIWCKDKLAVSIDAMKRVEKQQGNTTPVLVFSDMAPINEDNAALAPSWWRLAHVNPAKATLGTMLVQNFVTGCTAMANRSLIAKTRGIPGGAEMHDSWLGLVAIAFGVVCPLNEPLVRYRQHEGNAWGVSRRRGSGSLLTKFRHDHQLLKERVETSRRQAEVFAQKYANELTCEQKETLLAWLKSEDLPALVRQWSLHRHGLRGTTLHNHLGFLARV